MLKKFNSVSIFILTFSIFLSSVSFAVAAPDEGMFTPDQIGKLPLKQKGLKIGAAEIYNTSGAPDIADAIMRINIATGGFGTGEFVSANGLILTNHHVGFDALVENSIPGRDYASAGFKADNQSQELPAKGYNLLMTTRVENVTDKIRQGTANLTGDAFKNQIKANIEKMQTDEQAKAAKGATVRVQELNSGYYYYLYETQTINDVRVVYAPPEDIGFFGGDPDNFEWSRHTGDFTFMRAYVAPDGSSAEYSATNVPFHPKKFLTVSLNGIKENDFVMVMGYPGGTTRYRESQAVDYAANVNFPFLAGYLSAWSNALRKIGETDEAKRIALQSQIASLDNSRKVYEGGAVSLRRGDTLARRREMEQKFAAWVNANPARRAKYGEVLANLDTISKSFYTTSARDSIVRRFPNPASTPIFKAIFDAFGVAQFGPEFKPAEVTTITEAFKNREPILDREVLKFVFKSLADLPANQKFAPAEKLFGSLQGKARRDAEAAFIETLINNPDFDTADEVIALSKADYKDLQKKYPVITDFFNGFAGERGTIVSRTTNFNNDIDRLRLLYQQGMAEFNGTTPYPDANASLRFTYGAIKGYKPREAVVYTPFSTLKGVIEKDTGMFPFNVPEGLKDLQRKKDFGRYGEGDSVPVNFLATTDIIGGNSGSPIMNGLGEQVGIVFDGNYEGLGNDIFYNPDYGRTIAVDIRYVLFVTEKFAKAGWILQEMNIKGKAAAAPRGRG